MKRGVRTCWLLVCAAGALLAGGCSMQSNPSYFPHLLGMGDIIQSHAKPKGPSYFANFDPYACRLEVRPREMSNPVGQQHVIIATVYDKEGMPRRGRRVEWMLEGAGHIVEVDESGWAPGRGYKVDNRYAVSYTEMHEHTITRGNENPNDDFVIRPGQSWCVVSSAVEGDTNVTVYAPEIYNWDKHKINVTMHWINAGWTIPQPATNRIGADHPFVTNIFRLTDKMPLANYRVRYTIIDGPPAVFAESQQRVHEAFSNLQGNATATLRQIQPQAGTNRIGIEVIRPPDPCCPTGPGIIIGRGETFKEWLAGNIAITKTAPPVIGVGQPFNYTITVTNTGKVESDAVTVRDTVPEGLVFHNSNPTANREGNQLIWTLGPLGPGRSVAILATCRPDRLGTFTNTAVATTPEGLRSEATATVQVAAPQLNVNMAGPQSVVIGGQVNYQINVGNPGTAPATDVMLLTEFDRGLEHSSGERRLELPIGTVAPGQTRTVALMLTAKEVGNQTARVTARNEAGLSATGQHTVAVTQARLSISNNGPPFKFVGGSADWRIQVQNTGDAPLTNVVVRDQIPPGFTFVQASEGGQLVGGDVVWNIGTLQPRDERRFVVTARANEVQAKAVNVATVTADPNLQEQAQAPIEVRGAPGLRTELVDLGDPAEVGGTIKYEYQITNTGSLAARDIDVVATLSDLVELRNANGPNNSQPQARGKVLTFPRLERLEPNAKVTFEISVKALQAGDARVQFKLSSISIGPEPLEKNESTIITKPGGAGAPPAGGNAAPPPPAEAGVPPNPPP